MNMFEPSLLSTDWRNIKGSLNLKDAQKISENFFLVPKNDSHELLVVSPRLGIYIRTRSGGYIPRSGLLLAEKLAELDINGKALDIGTGETGILANCLIALGASSVTASDIDPQVIQWACQASNRSASINWVTCDLFPEKIADNAFRFITSNPPQMPMPAPGHPHDYGGADGREYICRIIKAGERLLHPEGRLLLLCFDFLGVEYNFGRESIVGLARMCGMQARVTARHQRVIRKGGKTEENVQWIKTMYPGYSFGMDVGGNFLHEILILEMKKE